MTKLQYPHLMRHRENAPVEAEDGDRVSQPQAAGSLGVSIWRVGLLIASGHLEMSTYDQVKDRTILL